MCFRKFCVNVKQPSKLLLGFVQLLLLSIQFLFWLFTGNPYSSAEAGVGPLMRDIKNKICQDCDLQGLLNEESSIELLVCNKIISLSLPVRAVFNKASVGWFLYNYWSDLADFLWIFDLFLIDFGLDFERVDMENHELALNIS